MDLSGNIEDTADESHGLRFHIHVACAVYFRQRNELYRSPLQRSGTGRAVYRLIQ
jgi:hypothetical protein